MLFVTGRFSIISLASNPSINSSHGLSDCCQPKRSSVARKQPNSHKKMRRSLSRGIETHTVPMRGDFDLASMMLRFTFPYLFFVSLTAFAGGVLFTRDTQAIFWNNHQTAVQRMLDYDTLIGRDLPSVAAIVSATGSSRFGKFFFGSSEILIPIYKSSAEAVAEHLRGSYDIEIHPFDGASVACANGLHADQLDMGFSASNWVGRALRGEEPFKQPIDIRMVAPANVGPMFFVARGAMRRLLSNITTRLPAGRVPRCTAAICCARSPRVQPR